MNASIKSKEKQNEECFDIEVEASKVECLQDLELAPDQIKTPPDQNFDDIKMQKIKIMKDLSPQSSKVTRNKLRYADSSNPLQMKKVDSPSKGTSSFNSTAESSAKKRP